MSAWFQTGALTSGLNYHRAARFVPVLLVCPTLTPTLVLWGEKDTALLLGNLEGLEYVLKLTVRRIPGGSHWVVHEQPGIVSASIGEFIGS